MLLNHNQICSKLTFDILYFHFDFQINTTDSQIMVSKFLIIESTDASTVNDKINENGETELHLAAAQNMKLSAMSLIKIGADVNAVCNLNETPLHKAIKNDHSNMVHFLRC